MSAAAPGCFWFRCARWRAAANSARNGGVARCRSTKASAVIRGQASAVVPHNQHQDPLAPS
eukprot:159605-Lingulodinium_polyedra.AAC.1